ncbi:MAG: hypothetical protein KDJ45_08420 [Hyphomicrobiaceae bacterium]|nr:hypothetical protein [Hyphomicrobiaceae bacterium]MCC0010018.1 hypothetical protein [Hyphomicrobiaceae bacterium]
MELGAMHPVFGIVVLPLIFVAAGVGLAMTWHDPGLLVVGAILAIATSYLARKNSGS